MNICPRWVTIASFTAVFFTGSLATGQRAEAPDHGCIVCHGKEGQLMAQSVHAAAGITCVSCHGGDGNQMVEAEAHGDALRPLRQARAAVESCAGCHSDAATMRHYGLRTDQGALYALSPHGLLLAKDETAEVATCSTCHTAHEVRKASDPRSPISKAHQMETCGGCHSDPARMDPYGVPVEVVQDYRESVHGRLMLESEHSASPACTDCHGSHGATPPRVEDLDQVCGHCHSVVREYFEQSPHYQAYVDGKMDGCISCHGSHDASEAGNELLIGEVERSCISCHARAGDPALDMARTLDKVLEHFDTSILDTEEELRLAAESGLFIESEHGYLEDARGLRVRARALTHALSLEALDDLQNRGLAMISETRESLAVKRRKLRDRKIFTSTFLGVTALLALVLMGYRRTVGGASDRRTRHES